MSASRDLYSTYAAELRKGGLLPAGALDSRRQQIETAVPVTAGNVVYRSDQLIGASIVNGKNEDLGSVDDIVMSPRTGKIAYLVVGHGGLWGIDEKYSAVPWTDFMSALGSDLLVLTVAKGTLDASPRFQRIRPTGWLSSPPGVRRSIATGPPICLSQSQRIDCA